jgi:hypothetical protein
MDEASSRADRRQRTRRRFWVVGAAVVVVLLIAGAVAVFAGGGNDNTSKSSPTTVARGNNVDLPLGTVSTDSAGAAVTVTPDQSQHVLAVLSAYVKTATVDPLRSGKPATADLATVFDPGTLARVTTTDRGIVLDEGLPKVTGNLDVVAQPITIVGLGDQSGNLTLVTASVMLDVKGQTAVPGGPLHVVRNGAFVLAPDASGAWKITAYNLSVTRGGAGLDTPTTTATSTTKAKK